MKSISRRQFLADSLAIGALAFSGNSYASSEVWPILNSWSFSEFEKYSKWINNIYKFKKNGTGRQKMARLGYVVSDDEMNLLNNPAFLENGNTQIIKDDTNLLTFLTDCGSFSELLILYYSYRRGLPAVVSKINMERGGDIRYSYGNHPIGQIDSISFNGNFREFFLASIEGRKNEHRFVSGNHRTSPTLEGTDSVPIALDRQFLRPGSICYNANGHCLVVGEIEDSGEVHFLDAHPDNSITFNQTLSAILRINSAKLGVNGIKNCYDGFRNPRLVKIVNGKATFFTNEEMISFGYSIEQYKKMAEINEKNLIEIRGEKVGAYPDLVRVSLKIGIEDPIRFLENSILEFAEMMRERAEFVEAGWNDVLSNGPITFPDNSSKENIYQANGRWETWSSPSSDVDRKNKYNYIASRLENMIDGYGTSEAYDYKSFTFKEEMIAKIIEKKKELFAKEKIIYKSSQGEQVELSLEEIEKRIFELSFDPNHDPALRWGAPENSDERKNMKLISTPLNSGGVIDALKIYELEKGLRYYPIRQTTPTSLNPEDNPKDRPFGLIEEKLGE